MTYFMLTREQLRWTAKDDELVEQFKKDMKAGKIQVVNFLELKRL